MKSGGLPVQALTAIALAAAVALAGCASASDDEAPAASGGHGGSSAGAGPGAGGASGGNRGGFEGGRGGSGGSAAGSGGSSSGGSAGGSSGTVDAGALADAGLPPSSDAAAPADAGLPPPACAIALSPITPPRFTQVPGGEGYRMRVGAVASGTLVPPTPMWSWSVRHESGMLIAHQTVDDDPAVIEFQTLLTGRTDIRVEILGLAVSCAAPVQPVSVVLPSQRLETFWLRVTAPADRRLPLLETEVTVVAGTTAPTRILELQTGFPVRVEPQDERALGLSAYYVRIDSQRSTSRLDGYVVSQPLTPTGFAAWLNPSQRYDVLIVPDEATGPARAPAVYPGLLPTQFGLQSFVVDPGVEVTGTVSTPAGPVPGARVRLRSGILPSTVGESGASGAFRLWTRAGRFEARVLPPEASGLPEARLPESQGLVLASPLPASASLGFAYADLVLAPLSLRVTLPGGAPPPAAVEVLLESDAGELANVGTFTLPDGSTRTAEGALRARRIAMGGQAVFERLPQALYRVTLVPDPSLPADLAITTTTLDLRGMGPAGGERVVGLLRRSRIQGQLEPAATAAGLTVKAVDTAPDGVQRTTLASVGTDGRYQILADPERVYRLFVEPPPDRRVPRVPLGFVRAKATDVSFLQRVPGRLPLTGVAQHQGQPVAGAVIQVYCTGAAPNCIDPAAPDVSSTPPLDETISAADGSYQLFLPDPG